MILPGENPIKVFGDSLEDAKEGAREAAAWCGSSPEAPIMKALSVLYLVKARPSEGTDDRMAVLSGMSALLKRYPKDLVLKAIEDHRGHFFPKIEELRGPIERSAAYRRRILVASAFREAVARIADQRPAASRISPEVRASVSEGFGRLRRELLRS